MSRKAAAAFLGRIYIWSPTVNLDATWRSVNDFQHGRVKVPVEEKDDLYREDFDEAKLRQVVQRKLAEA